jgi:glycosyltransferase involved in cell wall biosynthesis
VSVVVPVFDEEPGVRVMLEALRGALRDSGRVHEIVVVDDGSTDATPQILAACEGVTVIRHSENRGYGAALKTGIRAARHSLIVVIDADGTYPVAAIPALLQRCATADMAVGARIGRHVQSAPARNAAKWCFRQFAKWITGAPIPDLNSGLRAFHRHVAERFMPLFPDGFSFTTTITVASLVEGLAVGFEPVDYMSRIGRSKVRPLRDTARIARQLLWLGWQLAPLRTLAALLLPLLVVALGRSAYHLFELGRINQADVAALAVVALGLAIGAGAEQRVRRRRWASVRMLASVGK